MISAEKNVLSVTPASSSTLVDRPRRCDGARGSRRCAVATSEPAKLAVGTTDAEHAHSSRIGDREHRAERRARRDAKRKRRRQRIAQQRLQHDAGRRQGRADERRPPARAAAARRRRSARRRCRSQGIERSKARASEIGVLPTVGAHSITASANSANAGPRVQMRRRMLIAEASTRCIRRTGTTVMCPVSLVAAARRHRRRTARARCPASAPPRSGPRARTRPSRISTSSRQIAAARFRSCVEIAIVTPRSWLSRCSSAATSS